MFFSVSHFNLRGLIPKNGHQHNKKTPHGVVFSYCGGAEGIRTLDTLASIPHFQCGALDQLCDSSGLFYSSSSPASGVSSSSATSSSCAGSSTKVFSNSASISRKIGSSRAISKDSSALSLTGVSL